MRRSFSFIVFFFLIYSVFVLNGCKEKFITGKDYAFYCDIFYNAIDDKYVEVTSIKKILPNKVYVGSLSIPDQIDIPNDGIYEVIGVGDSAFLSCTQLTMVSLPTTLRYVKRLAFANCTSLTVIACKGANPPLIDSTAFEGCDIGKITLYVYNESVEAYRQDKVWGQLDVKAYDDEEH